MKVYACKFKNAKTQARRQDSVTKGGAEINFGAAREVYLCEIERGKGAREIYSSVDQTNKVKTKKKRSSVQKFPQILVVVSKFLRFSANSLVKTKKNKGLRPKSFMKSGVSPEKFRKYGR